VTGIDGVRRALDAHRCGIRLIHHLDIRASRARGLWLLAWGECYLEGISILLQVGSYMGESRYLALDATVALSAKSRLWMED
jgi:hypothetical protein